MTPEQEQDAERLCILFCDFLPKQTPAEKAKWYGLTVIYGSVEIVESEMAA